MIILKSYCYNDHELPFIIAQLTEGFDYIDKLILYEYNYTHTGLKKDYKIHKHLDKIPEHLRSKLMYKMVDLSGCIDYAYNDEDLIHAFNEPLMRCWIFNDKDIVLKDDDIIIDIDIDEIVYKHSYPELIKNARMNNVPVSFRVNQFFYKHNYLWKDAIFKSSSVYMFSSIKQRFYTRKSNILTSTRDFSNILQGIYGAHMSWIMPIRYIQQKLESYSHPRYRIYNNPTILKKAIEDKSYIFDVNRPFTIEELPYTDNRIPVYLQRPEIFEYIEDARG